MFTWTGWHAETDLDNDDDREDVYYLTINSPNGEEYAVIVHRTVGGKYPLDGTVATQKIARADFMCVALNQHFHSLGG